MIRKTRVLVCVYLCAFALATVSQAGTPDLGTLTFPNSGAPEAQDAFIRGALLLHSFEYEDAREAFQEARQRSPRKSLPPTNYTLERRTT